MNDNIFCLGIKIINFACMIPGTADGLFNLNKLLLELKQAARMPINLFSMWQSRGLMWELGTSLGSDKLIRKWLREFCMPTTILIPAATNSHRQKYLWWEKTGISLLDLYLRQSRAQAQHKLKQNNILTEKDMKNHKAVYASASFIHS